VDEFELEELGTIEEVSYKQIKTKKKARELKKFFYDSNSIGDASKYKSSMNKRPSSKSNDEAR